MSARPDPLIRFSVIVATYNRAPQLRLCLESLALQDYPRDGFEVIVVDDGGPGTLEPLVDAFSARLQVRLLRQARTGPGPARNAGTRVARGAWLAFTDDDCRPAPGWLTALERALSASPRCAVGGRTVNALEGSRCSNASQSLVSYLYAAFQTPDGRPRFFASNNLAIAADVFADAGGFDTTVPLFPAEDRELCDRLTDAGCALIYAPDAVVHHAHPLTLRRFCRQHFVYGRGALRYHRLRAARRRDRIRVEPVAFYGNLLRHPFRTGDDHALSTAALLALSQFAHTAGFVWERIRPSGGKPPTY